MVMRRFLLKFMVDYLHIRPLPPHLRHRNFDLLEKVDVYYDFGWRTGVITKKLADDKYNVSFKHTKHEREFNYSRARPHMEWKGGKWFNTSQGDMNERTTRLLMDGRFEQTPPSITNQLTVATSIMKTTKHANLDCNDKSSIPSKILKDVMLIDYPSKRQNEGFDSAASEINDQAFSKTGNLFHGKKVHSKRGSGIELNTPIVNSSKKRGRLSRELKSLLNYRKGPKVDSTKTTRKLYKRIDATKELRLPVVLGLQSKDTTVSQEKIIQKLPLTAADKAGNESDAASVAPKKKRGRPPRIQALSPETVAASLMKRTKHANLDCSDKSSPPSKILRDETLIDDPSKRQNETPVGQSDGFDFENLSDGKKVDSKRGSGIGQDAPILNYSRKRGRLANELKSLLNYRKGPKLDSAETTLENGLIQPGAPLLPLTAVDNAGNAGDVALSPETAVTVKSQKGGVDPSSVFMANNAHEKKVKDSPILPLTKDKLQLPNENREQSSSVRRGSKKKSSMKGKRGKRRMNSINKESRVLVSGVDSQNADVRLENDNARKNLEVSLDKSLDTVFDDQPLSTWFEGLQSHGPVVDMEQSSEKCMEIVTYSNGETLPFVRSTPLWKTLESMEAFQKIPQRPHFRPLLEGVNKSAREGVIFGMMVTFSTMVDMTRAFKFDDPRSEIEDCLETLVELEDNGFDVNVIRERLMGLLEQKDKNDELDERSKRVGEKIEECRKVQGENVDEEMEELHRQLRELEERRRRVLLKKDKRNLEIGVMKKKAEKIEREMRDVCAEFDGLAATPL